MNLHIFTLSLLTVAALNIISTPDNTSESFISDREPKNTLGNINFYDNPVQNSAIDAIAASKQARSGTKNPIIQKNDNYEMALDNLEPNDTSNITMVFRSR